MSDTPKKKRPNPMRLRASCPTCGWIDARWDTSPKTAFDCERCGAHFSAEDFFRELDEKRMALRHNTALADLSGEEP